MDKKSLRSQYLKAREKITPDDAKAAGIAITRHLLQLIPENAAIVAGYVPVRGEIDISEALAQLSERGHELCLPVVDAPGKPLIFRRWRVGHKLELGHYGIPVPPESQPVEIPDALIVPLAAFDKSGHRLGYGAGFYDAAIRHLRASGKKIIVIGAAFSTQHVDAIPAEDHDEKLDAIATEKGVIPALVAGSG